MKERTYTRAELDRAHELYDAVLLGLALASQTDWGGDLKAEPFDLCKLVARIETVSRRLARQMTRGCTVPDTPQTERARRKTREQLERLAAEYAAFGPEFTYEFTTGVACPIDLMVNHRHLSHRGVYHGS